MLGIQKSRERSISERSASQEEERSGDRSPGPKFGSNKSVFSSFIDGVKNLANRLSEKAGNQILDHSNHFSISSSCRFLKICFNNAADFSDIKNCFHDA